MAGKKGQKKRFWSNEEKVSICAQTCAPGVLVAQVARRYAKNTNLIHKWLRDPEFAPDQTGRLRNAEHSDGFKRRFVAESRADGVSGPMVSKPHGFPCARYMRGVRV